MTLPRASVKLLNQMMENRPEKPTYGVTRSLSAIVLLGTILRFLHLGRQSVWIDEGFSWLAVQMGFGDVTRLSLVDVHPPLYYYLLKISLWVLPNTEFGLRFVSALSSVATLVVMITFVYRRWGYRIAWYVGLLAALSPFDIYYAQEGRMYALLAFLFVLAFTELVESLEGKPTHLIGWVAANIGLAWTHAYGLLAVVLQVGLFVCYGIAQYLRGRSLPLKPKVVLAAFATLFLGLAPILLLFWKIRSNPSGSVLLPETNRLLYLVRCWTTGPMNAFPAYKIPWRLHDLTALAIIGSALLGVRQLWKRGDRYRWILFFAIALIVLPAALIYLYSTFTKHALWVDRGFLGSAHLLYLLAGIGLGAMGSRIFRGLVTASIGISIVTGEIYYFTRFEKSLAASAFHSLPTITSDRVLLLSPPWLDCEAYYYLRSYTPCWGIAPKTPQQLMRVDWEPGRMPRGDAVACDETNLQAVSEIYVFGNASEIRIDRKNWPACVLTKKIWVFEQSHWHPLDE